MAKIKPAKIVEHPEENYASLSLDQFSISLWLPWVKVEKNSWKVDELIFHQYISPSLGGLAISTITSKDIQACLGALETKNLSLSTRNRILYVWKITLKTFYTSNHL